MTAQVFQPIAARPAPNRTTGWAAWARSNLFSDWKTTLGTVAVVAVFLYLLPSFFRWAVLDAVTVASPDACHAAQGACWGVVKEKFRFILFGRYPFDEHWRALIATVALLILIIASCMRLFWKPWLAGAWVLVLMFYFTIMYGGVLGLRKVETDLWSGLPLTILLASLSMIMAFPIALCIALGRRSGMPAIRSLCTVYVELIRGVPLISVLFMASFILPLFMPQGTTIDVLARVLIGMTLFAAAYLAEVIRGGLQAVPKGQLEAAQSLGLSYWQMQRKIVLPQALRLVVPAMVNTFIGVFKDTSLVTIVSLYDLTGAVQLALGDADWRKFFLEGQLFVAALYFVACFAMSRYSVWLEQHLNTGTRRQ